MFVGIDFGKIDFEVSFEEFSFFVFSVGVCFVVIFMGWCVSFDVKMFIGSGKVEELWFVCDVYNVEIVIFNYVLVFV